MLKRGCQGENETMNLQKLFKPYFVRRKHGQCQVLIPFVELDELCEKIEERCFDYYDKAKSLRLEKQKLALAKKLGVKKQ